MRELTLHKVNECNSALTITADERDANGGCSHYNIIGDKVDNPLDFQNGPIKEVGTNGITHEALLAILIDRLEGSQSGPYKCEENGFALVHLKDAFAYLKLRTVKRELRGVEGTHAI
jgi:hypothetical protein